MRAFERLLPVAEDSQNELVYERTHGYSTCFWISYSLFMVGVGAVSMWLFFKYVIMG